MNTSKASTFTAAAKGVAKRLARRGMHGFACAAVVGLMVGVQSGYAADLTWDRTPGTVGTGDNAITGGDGTWNASNGNWTIDAGTNNIAWDNTSPSLNTATFAAVAGARTVTLGEAINLKAISITSITSANRYVITGNTLNFATGGTITLAGDVGSGGEFRDAGSISSAISGAPNVVNNVGGVNDGISFSPTSGSQVFGIMSGAGTFNLAGSTTGNSLAGTGANNNMKLWVTSGTWELTGTFDGDSHFIKGGALIISTGTLKSSKNQLALSGGTVLLNNDNAIWDNVTTAGTTKDFYITGGTIDNTSGSARTLSRNPGMTFGGPVTFAGSNGAASDLNMGTGGVLLTSNPQVSVTHAATTLTLGGVISGTSFGLGKAGAGTLQLSGTNTYSGATTITNGTLVGVVGGSCSNSAVTVGSTGTLGVKVTDTNKQWTCSSVTVSTGTAAKLKFVFTGAPSKTKAPLNITGAVTFTGTPTVEIVAPELTVGTYPLLKKGDGTALAVPPLSGSSGILAWSGDNTTLNLIIPPAGTMILLY